MTACNSVQDVNLGKKAVSAALAGHARRRDGAGRRPGRHCRRRGRR